MGPKRFWPNERVHDAWGELRGCDVAAKKRGRSSKRRGKQGPFLIYVLTKGAPSMVDVRLGYSPWKKNFRRNEFFVVPQFPNTQVTLALPT